MSRSPTPKTPKATTRPATPVASTTTAVRNTAIPKAAPRAASHEAIAKRAYEISQSPQRGSDHDNWVRAERELKGL